MALEGLDKGSCVAAFRVVVNGAAPLVGWGSGVRSVSHPEAGSVLVELEQPIESRLSNIIFGPAGPLNHTYAIDVVPIGAGDSYTTFAVLIKDADGDPVDIGGFSCLVFNMTATGSPLPVV